MPPRASTAVVPVASTAVAVADDDDDVHALKEAVRSWFMVDTSITSLQTALRERRAFKVQLTERILMLMRQMQVKNLEVADHSCVLRYKVTRTRAPLSQSVVQERLKEYYASDPGAGQAVAQAVFQREPVERVQLRHTRTRTRTRT